MIFIDCRSYHMGHMNLVSLPLNVLFNTFYTQMAHVGKNALLLLHPITLGLLKNEVLERKHKELKNMHTVLRMI